MGKPRLKEGDVCYLTTWKLLVRLSERHLRLGLVTKEDLQRWSVDDYVTHKRFFVWAVEADLEGPLNEMEILAWSAK